MDLVWRKQNDWIHRDSENRLLEPLQAIHLCGERNIREKSILSAEAVQRYFVENERNLDKMKAIQPDAVSLQKVI